LQQNHTLRRFFNRNSYLPVLAAWFITLSFIIDNYWAGNSSVGSVKKNIQFYVQQQEKDFDKVVADTAVINKLTESRYDEELLLRLADKKYFIYQYFVNDVGLHELKFWSTQAVLPPENLLEAPGRSGFMQLLNGFYVWRKSVTAKTISIALIPVKWQYFVTNKYLENTFATGKEIANSYDIAKQPTADAVRSVDGNDLFYLLKKVNNLVPKNNLLAVWFRILAAIFILLFLHLYASYIALHNRLWKATAFLVVIVAGLRVVSYYFPIPVNFRQFELFDPAVYGSTVVLRSLGDLLINSVLFVWIVLFIRQQLQEKNIVVAFKRPLRKWLLLGASSIILLAATFITGQVIRSLVADSQISFDVINFFTLNIYSVTGFLVLCCMAIGYFFLGQILLYLVKPLFAKNMKAFYLMIAVFGLIYLTLLMNIGNAGFELFSLGWLLVYLLLLDIQFLALSATHITSTRLVFWLFFFSLTITAVIVQENGKKEMNSLHHYAETLSNKADPFNETLLNTLLTDFSNDFLAENFERLKTETGNHNFKDSLVNGNFSGYNNKYETRVYTFDANEQSLYNTDSSSFNELNTLLNTQAKPTSNPDLFYYDESYDRYGYISRKNITNSADSLLGYVFILASQKKNKIDALYLDLFSKGDNNAIENSTEYAFAVYNNLQLVNNHNDYAFATRLTPGQLPKDEFESFTKNNYVELWYKASPQKVVIIARKNNFVIESITLFSYLFCAFLLVTSIFWLLNIFIRSRFNRQRIRTYWQLSIRTQIHGTIIFISVFSFLIIGIATILFFISRYENNNREKLSRTIHVMENEVRNSLADLAVFDDVVKVYDMGYREKLEQMIAKISEIHAADINLYDLDGNLRASSLPLPYNKGIVSTKMDPVAFYHLNTLKEVQFFKNDQIGKLNFVSNYIPVLDGSGHEYVYLNIPYFTSETKLKQEIANFLVTIINLNAFIFLIAGIISLFITNRITRSFSIISEKMKAVNLGTMNEEIAWNRNDEIGELVKEYNKMVGKLDESAAALAKSEREGAWREMARQVAHEIKNPLTPMKLSLQYLQKAIAGDAANVKELTANVAQTLVEQIDHLNQIAGEFSQFANIGNPRNEIFDLQELLRSLTQLHATDDKLQLSWKPVPDPVIIYADRTHVNRLFTNLIQNAIQAVPQDRIAMVEIEESQKEDTILIVVKDNGLGIEETMRPKIFTPNFTTKTSGTGLGLAMCKGIVEQAKGKIWFTTVTGEGSSFFVELPLAKEV
jgi:signal transduction histidine kinase